MRVLLILLAALCAGAGLSACSPSPEKAQSDAAETIPAKKCPDVNIRDRNDPCSPLYFKKKGSALKDRDSL